MTQMTTSDIMLIDKIKNKPAIASLKLAELLDVPHHEVLKEARRIMVQERLHLFDYSVVFSKERGLSASALIIPSRIAKSVAMRTSRGRAIGPDVVKKIRGREKKFLLALGKQELILFIESNCLSFD